MLGSATIFNWRVIHSDGGALGTINLLSKTLPALGDSARKVVSISTAQKRSYAWRRHTGEVKRTKQAVTEMVSSYLRMILDRASLNDNDHRHEQVLRLISRGQNPSDGAADPGDEGDSGDITTTLKDYPVNRYTIDELTTTLHTLLNPDTEDQSEYLDLFPSMCEGMVVMVSPFASPDLYIRCIVKQCTENCKAAFVKIDNSDLFSRISAPSLLKHALEDIQFGDLRSFVKSNRQDSRVPGFGGGNSQFSSTILGMNFTSLNSFPRSIQNSDQVNTYNSKDAAVFAAPYPWFSDYSHVTGGNPPLIVRRKSLSVNFSEVENVLFSVIKSFFTKLAASAQPGQRVVVLYEDLWDLAAFGGAKMSNLLSAMSLQLQEVRKRGIRIVLVTFTSPSTAANINNYRGGPELYEDIVFYIIKNNLRKSSEKRDDGDEDLPASPSANGFPPPENTPFNPIMSAGKSSMNYDSFSRNYLGLYHVNVLPPMEPPGSLDKLKSHLWRDFYTINLEKNLREIRFLASHVSLDIECDEDYFAKRVSEANSVTPRSDTLAIFGYRRLTPLEIEKIIIFAINGHRKKSTSDSDQGPRLRLRQRSDKGDNKGEKVVISHEVFLEACELVSRLILSSEMVSFPEKYADRFHKSNKTTSLPTMTKNESEIYSQCYLQPGSTDFKLSSVGGLAHCKKIIKEVVELPLLRPELFSKGALKNTTTGVLLFGPPGTGKTLVCRAVAAESNINFLNIQPSAINSMWLGESEKNICAIFSLARKLAPCIIFIDEVDSVLCSRLSMGPRYLNSTVNQFMQEWDGLLTNNKGVIVIGTTNRPFDMDEASLRRFPCRVMIDIPDYEERKEIIRILVEDENIDPNISRDELISKVAEMTKMFTGSDIKNLCISAAFNAIRNSTEELPDASSVDKQIFESRKLALDHFDQAIKSKQVTPSLEKEADLITSIRAWNKLYGTGPKTLIDLGSGSWGFT